MSSIRGLHSASTKLGKQLLMHCGQLGSEVSCAQFHRTFPPHPWPQAATAVTAAAAAAAEVATVRAPWMLELHVLRRLGGNVRHRSVSSSRRAAASVRVAARSLTAMRSCRGSSAGPSTTRGTLKLKKEMATDLNNRVLLFCIRVVWGKLNCI
jgi:hypothetical protein